jgi:hypothetical protein
VNTNRIIYMIVGGVLFVLLIVMLLTWTYNRSSDQATAKAQQLITAFGKAGLPTPASAENVAKVFGTDGGTVCASVQNGVGLGIAKLNLSVGGAFYTRAVIADKRLATGLLLVVQTYCPDKIATAQQFVDNQRFGNTVGG